MGSIPVRAADCENSPTRRVQSNLGVFFMLFYVIISAENDLSGRSITMITEQEFLEKYDPSSFERPSITADVLVFTVRESTLQILMVRRDEHPFLGKWCLPGSFIVSA